MSDDKQAVTTTRQDAGQEPRQARDVMTKDVATVECEITRITYKDGTVWWNENLMVSSNRRPKGGFSPAVLKEHTGEKIAVVGELDVKTMTVELKNLGDRTTKRVRVDTLCWKKDDRDYDHDWADVAIPAGESRAVHQFEVDLTGFLGDFFPQAGVKNGEPFVMHEVSLHMHTRGRRASLELDRAGADDVCALYIPDWDFSWQGGYKLREPLTVQPGDRLRLTCEWDNSAANQPIEDGVQVEPADLFWGEGTGDEMCLSILTISPAH